MGSFARLSALSALAGLLVGCGGRNAATVAVPAWAKGMPGDTMFVAWRPDGAPLAPPPELAGSMDRGAAWRRVDVGEARGLARVVPVTTGWKSLADSSDFQEALTRLLPAQECYFESALWVEQGLEKAFARVPDLIARRLRDALQLTTLRYVWCVRDLSTGGLRGAIETTGTESGIGSALGVAVTHAALLPPLAKERAVRVRGVVDPRALKRLLGVVIGGSGDTGSPLEAALPIGLLQPFLERVEDLAGPVAAAGVATGGDYVLAASLARAKPMRELCEERFRRKGPGFVTPFGIAVIVEDDRLLLFGADAPEFAQHVAGAREAELPAEAPASLVVRFPESTSLPGLAGTLRITRASLGATSVAFTLSR